MTKFYSMARRRTKEELINVQKFFTTLRNECEKQEDETAAGLVVFAQGRETYSLSEAVQHAWDSVDQALKNIEREKARIS